MSIIRALLAAVILIYKISQGFQKSSRQSSIWALTMTNAVMLIFHGQLKGNMLFVSRCFVYSLYTGYQLNYGDI